MPDALTHHPAAERRSPGSFEYYNAGSFDGPGPDLFVFTCWSADHGSCGTHSVYAPDLAANIAALEAAGHINRTDRCEYWLHSVGAWIQGSGRQRVGERTLSRGLPIHVGADLKDHEREALQRLAKIHRDVADQIDQALSVGTLDCALTIAEAHDHIAQTSVAILTTIGTRQ